MFTPVNTVKELFKIIPEPKMLKEIVSDHTYRYQPEVIQEINEAMGRFIEQYELV